MSRSRRPRLRWRIRQHSVDTSTALIRFVGDQSDLYSGEPTGIFQVASRLRRSRTLAVEEQQFLCEQIRWFNRYLAQPRRFSPYKNGWKRSRYGCFRDAIAVSWFKNSATGHISRAEALAGFLRSRGIEISTITTVRPGYVTYEDSYQVVAVPFR
jgi:hypothetical protein